MPRHPLPRPPPPPPCAPWLLESTVWRKQLKDYKRTLRYYWRYRLLLAKEKRLRAAAARESRQHAAKFAELQELIAQRLLEESFALAETDPYCIVKTEFKK